MDEYTSAVMVAAITAGFGFLGVLVTQWLSRAKARQLGKEDEVKSLVKTGDTRDIVDHIAALNYQVRENGITAREGIQSIREDVSDIRDDVKEMKRLLRQIL